MKAIALNILKVVGQFVLKFAATLAINLAMLVFMAIVPQFIHRLYKAVEARFFPRFLAWRVERTAKAHERALRAAHREAFEAKVRAENIAVRLTAMEIPVPVSQD